MEPNWELIMDLALKASADAKEAIGRTVALVPKPMEAVLVTMVAYAILRGEHDGIVESMQDSPAIGLANDLAGAVAEALKNLKKEELDKFMPAIREAMKRTKKG